MKKSMLIIALVVTASIFLINGGCRFHFDGLHKIASSESATLVVSSRSSGVIDLRPIRAMLAHAEWIDGRPINKGGYWLKIDGFPDIFVGEVNGCFWMPEHKGLFRIGDGDRAEFYEYLDGEAKRISEE